MLATQGSAAEGSLRKELGHGPVGALGERLVVALEDRDEVRGDAGRALRDEPFQRDAAHHRVGVVETGDQALLYRRIALADRGKDGGRGGPQIDAIVLEQPDHLRCQVLTHGRDNARFAG
ncbi:MAG: hypothetical protein K8M05_39530 [Deltaproteobacteria bacterium]|nr:hypothetical protein [Kofleriaceae bacterium]